MHNAITLYSELEKLIRDIEKEVHPCKVGVKPSRIKCTLHLEMIHEKEGEIIHCTIDHLKPHLDRSLESHVGKFKYHFLSGIHTYKFVDHRMREQTLDSIISMLEINHPVPANQSALAASVEGLTMR